MYFDISVYSTFIFFALINNGSTSRCKTDLQPCKLYQVGVKSFQAPKYGFNTERKWPYFP